MKAKAIILSTLLMIGTSPGIPAEEKEKGDADYPDLVTVDDESELMDEFALLKTKRRLQDQRAERGWLGLPEPVRDGRANVGLNEAAEPRRLVYGEINVGRGAGEGSQESTSRFERDEPGPLSWWHDVERYPMRSGSA